MKIYSEPIAKVMFLNVNAAICDDPITPASVDGGGDNGKTAEPLF